MMASSMIRHSLLGGCPMELCREAFHHESIQKVLLSDESVRDTLCGLYRLHEWEEDDKEAEDETAGPTITSLAEGPWWLAGEDSTNAAAAAAAAGDGADVKLDRLLLSLELVHDNLDCLFLRLRETPSLFRTSTAHGGRPDGLSAGAPKRAEPGRPLLVWGNGRSKPNRS